MVKLRTLGLIAGGYLLALIAWANCLLSLLAAPFGHLTE
jgi:hypothetical protein